MKSCAKQLRAEARSLVCEVRRSETSSRSRPELRRDCGSCAASPVQAAGDNGLEQSAIVFAHEVFIFEPAPVTHHPGCRSSTRRPVDSSISPTSADRAARSGSPLGRPTANRRPAPLPAVRVRCLFVRRHLAPAPPGESPRFSAFLSDPRRFGYFGLPETTLRDHPEQAFCACRKFRSHFMLAQTLAMDEPALPALVKGALREVSLKTSLPPRMTKDTRAAEGGAEERREEEELERMHGRRGTARLQSLTYASATTFAHARNMA